MATTSETNGTGVPSSVEQKLAWKQLPICFLIIGLSGIGAGVSSAIFLVLLDSVTRIQQFHSKTVWFLPVFGAAAVLLYKWFGAGTEQGVELILKSYRDDKIGVPLRMAPLILFSTLLTHLGGGSAGREGTAVQMAVGLLSGTLKRLELSSFGPRLQLECAIAAGFGAVFGTPLAGAVFALEMPMRGQMSWHRLPWTLAAGALGHWVCVLCGARHSHFGFSCPAVPLHYGHWIYAVLLGVASGLAARVFVLLTHQIQFAWKRSGLHEIWWPVLAGLVIASFGTWPGFSPFLGLGVESLNEAPTLLTAFQEGGAPHWSWLWKLLFTAVTVASGFRGGEVTPLFFVGATLGNAMSAVLGGPTDYLAALGFVAVFAGASHTPRACALMGAEVFGWGLFPVGLLACWISDRISGDSGIYPNRAVPNPGTGRQF